jgi:hypothetical protein
MLEYKQDKGRYANEQLSIIQQEEIYVYLDEGFLSLEHTKVLKTYAVSSI